MLALACLDYMHSKLKVFQDYCCRLTWKIVQYTMLLGVSGSGNGMFLVVWVVSDVDGHMEA